LQQLGIAMLAGTILGCVFGTVVIGVMLFMNQGPLLAAFFATQTPTETATLFPTITLAPTRTPTLVETPIPTGPPTLSPSATTAATSATGTRPAATRTATRAPSPSRTPRAVVQHFLVGRPVASNASATTPALFYLYGTTGVGQYDVHHGEEFVNPSGTPLYAAADGAVVTAGSDDQPICGDNGKTVCGRGLMAGGFYGKLVVIQLASQYNGQHVFALYGHMSKINVSVGDQVKTGDPLGEIGMSGIAEGPHVHFEIRLGTNDYAHTRNPILWMTPLPGRGALAGRYLDARGNPVRGALVDIYRADGSYLMETETYSRDRWPAVNADDDLGENFAVGDLPAGDYIVRINVQKLSQRITVQNGKLSFVEIGGLQ
jgi:murein DD-endopeptidase MepM/ murein hydrolase activator NlpD